MSTAKKTGWAFIKLFVFWMLFFLIQRTAFLIYEYKQLQGISLSEILSVYVHALRLDASASCYLMALPFLLLILQSLFPHKFLDRLLNIYVGIFIFIYSAITAGEMGIFDEWHTKLHYKALLYLAHPSEVVNTAGTGMFLTLTGMIVLLWTLSFFLWRKYFFVRTSDMARKPIFTVVFTLITPFLLILGIRGGVQQIPVNESSCYYSRKDILNLAAINSGWNLLHSILENRCAMGKNPFTFYATDQATKQVKSLMTVSCDSTTMVLDRPRPNIVMFILEGWSADVLSDLGGDKGIAPFVDSIAQKGILFTQLYNSGTRSQQGISAIFSGYPCFPYTTITQHPEKYRGLPSMINKLDSVGYETAFTFGGALNYGNLRSYLSSNAFDHIKEQKDLPSSLPSGKLGVHDEYMLPIFMEDIDKMKEPFFSAIFTVSTHSPYDQKMPQVFTKYAYEEPYVNAVHYSDACLADFFAKASHKAWFKNTLFILVSDHSHSSYRNTDYFDPDYNRIVCTFYGKVIKPEYCGLQIGKIGSQTDIARTLLRQMNISNGIFAWGKDMLNPCSPDYAYYSFEVGLGWVRPWGAYAVHFSPDQPLFLRCDSTAGHNKELLEHEGKSYLQTLYDDFLKR